MIATVALFGDSVFAGYGLAPEDAPAAQLRHLVPEMEVIAVGVPDETAGDGLQRIGTIAADIVALEFGLNDAIEGVPVERTEATLTSMVRHFQARGSRVLLVEARVPVGSQWGAQTDHAGLFARIAAACRIALVPDVVELCRGERQPDGLHPTAEGARKIAVVLAKALNDVR